MGAKPTLSLENQAVILVICCFVNNCVTRLETIDEYLVRRYFAISKEWEHDS